MKYRKEYAYESETLVKKNVLPMTYDVEQYCLQATQKRLVAYYNKVYQYVA